MQYSGTYDYTTGVLLNTIGMGYMAPALVAPVVDEQGKVKAVLAFIASYMCCILLTR